MPGREWICVIDGKDNVFLMIYACYHTVFTIWIVTEKQENFPLHPRAMH